MSVLNKVPYIQSLLNSLSEEELSTLLALMNGSGNRTPLKRTVNPIDDAACPHISVDDKGVHMCMLTMNYTNFTGYLCYTDDYCALISYTDSIVLKVFDIDVANVSIRTIDEAITALELRTEVNKIMGGGGSEVVANPALVGNELDLISLKVGSETYKILGKVRVTENLGQFTIASADKPTANGVYKLIDSDGLARGMISYNQLSPVLIVSGFYKSLVFSYTYAPEPTDVLLNTGNLYVGLPSKSSEDSGKVLGVNSYGSWELKTISGGGIKLYKHEISKSGSTFYLITKSSTQLTTQTELRDAMRSIECLSIKNDDCIVFGYWTHPSVPSNGLGLYYCRRSESTVPPTEPTILIKDLTSWTSFTDTVTEL